MRQLRARQVSHISSVYFEPTRFGRSSATSSDESAEENTETEVHSEDQDIFDESKPFPCSYPACNSFHSSETGYCERHRWLGLGKRICAAVNARRQHVELGLLLLAQAVAEVESRNLLFMIVLSLLPAASYGISESTGVSGTLIFLLFAGVAVASIVYTTARLNRMQELAKKLEVETEALYAKNLQKDMSGLFGDRGGGDIAQPHITTLKDHFIEARKQFDSFDKYLCLPLLEFLEEQPASMGSISRQDLRPTLMTLSLAQEAAVREGDPSRIFDLLYCNIMFDDWEKMVSAWCFLKTRAGCDDLAGIEMVCARDSFAFAQAGIRCAEMIFKINNYLATIRFLQASLTKLEHQLDNLHPLAEQLGLVAGHSQLDPLHISRRPARQSLLLVVGVSSLRITSLLVAMYLAGQYFVRYSPSFIRSNLPHLIREVFALKQTLDQPTRGKLLEVEGSHSQGWWEESVLSLLPSFLFSLPYLALMIVLLSDLRRCRSTNIKWKPLRPTQILYDEYFGIEGKLYSFKVAALQFFTVMLQALGKLQILGGLVSFAFHAAAKHLNAFQGCYWAFVGFLCLNSIYPTILLAFSFVKRVRMGAAMMDAILDIAYTTTYLIITLLAIYELQLDQDISGNFGDEAAVKFQAELDPAFAFPSDFLGFFAVYYSLAHVCAVCRALEHNNRETQRTMQGLPSSPSELVLSPARFSSLRRLKLKRCRIFCKVLHPDCINFCLVSGGSWFPILQCRVSSSGCNWVSSNSFNQTFCKQKLLVLILWRVLFAESRSHHLAGEGRF